MRLSSRLSVVAAVAIAGLVPTLTTSAAAALAPHTRPTASRASITSGTAPLWAAQFKGTVGDTAGYADAVSPDGSMVFVTGNSGSSTIRLHNVGVTLAYNSATGTVLWQTRYNPTFAHNAHFNDVAVSPDGSMVFVTGQLQVATSGSDINAITAAYNASTGAQVWANVDQTMRAGNSITVSPDGSTVFVAGGARTPWWPTAPQPGLCSGPKAQESVRAYRPRHPPMGRRCTSPAVRLSRPTTPPPGPCSGAGLRAPPRPAGSP